jgi:trans-L-3-hydroxyproline dehydratase
VLEPGLEVEVDGQPVECTIAFGGAFYAYVDAAPLGFKLDASEAPELIRLGRKIKQAVNAGYEIRHPDGDDDLNYLYGTIFIRAGDNLRQSRNACVFAQGQLDRSPTGTGVSGRAAIHHARGDIGLHEELLIESIIGSEFRVHSVEETRVGPYPAIVPEVTGSAHMTGEHRFTLDERDPLKHGFLLR